MTRPVETVLQKLKGVKPKSGGGWMARCPAHEDENASLSIDEKEDGTVLLKCFACCTFDAIRAALRMEKREFFVNQDKGLIKKRSLPAPTPPPPFNWQKCVDAFGEKESKKLRRWRVYSATLVQWLKESELVGVYEGAIAFPVCDNDGTVVGAHYRPSAGNDWFYAPKGIRALPFVIGGLGETCHVFESQWDMFAYADLSGERSGLLCTRGSGNSRVVNGLIPEGATVYVWEQNDGPGRKWTKSVSDNLKDRVVKIARVPEKFKDVNDWQRAGATAEELLGAMVAAETASMSTTPFEGFDSFGGGLESENIEPFPLSSLPPLVEAFAREVCATALVPERLAGSCALGILSASIGPGLEVQSAPDRVTRANIYICVSADISTGKSAGCRHMAKPLFAFEQERARAWQENERADLRSRRGLLEVDIQATKKIYAKEHNIDAGEELKAYERELEELNQRLHEPCLVVQDITTEKLAVVLSQNNETITSLSSDALSIVNILLGRYNKLDRTDEAIYLSGYSSDPIRIARMSRESISLNSPCITALWLTQPDKLQSLLDERSLNEGGLIPRLLACHTYCEPQEIPEHPACISMATRKAYEGLIYSLLSRYRLAPESFVIQPTPEALQLLDAHYNAIVKRRRGDLRDVAGHAGRWTEQAWRIAVCLHAGMHGSTAHEQPLALETAQRAITLADWFAVEQLHILQAGRTQRKYERFEKLQELLLRYYKGTATLRDLQLRNGFKVEEVRELVENFPGILTIETLKTGGRPSETVSLSKK